MPCEGACPESTDSGFPGVPSVPMLPANSHQLAPASLRRGLPSDGRAPLPVLGRGKCQQMVSLNSRPPWGQPCDMAGGRGV